MPKLKLSQVPTGSSFIDSNSTYNGNALEWCVVAHGVDGENISTLILRTRSVTLPYDAKEPLNPDTNKRDNGNTSYEYSNILQFLNSDGLANQWYTNQHEYDQSPSYPYVEQNYQYANKDAFLAHFTEDFKVRLRSVEKMGVTRKVHLPAPEELVKTSSSIHKLSDTNIVFDIGNLYGTYNFIVSSGSYVTRGLVRGTHATITPWASIHFKNNEFYYIGENEYTYDDTEPYRAFGVAFPVVFLDSNSPVEYNTTDQKYYASWDSAPVLTVQDINTWQSSAFNIVFNVTDADIDTVSTTVKVDDTTIYSNAVTPLGSNITVSTTGIWGNLVNGEHEVGVVCSDGEKEAKVTKLFKKVDTAPYVLSTVSENRIFVDNNTLYNGEPIEWYVAAKEVDGKGVVSLMMKNPIANHCFDEKEPYNPNTVIAENGYSQYSQSNILQWLNSDKKANEWYEDQHQYDSPPDYENEDGFLNHFSASMICAMNDINKFGSSRKVHIASRNELIRDTVPGGDNYYFIDQDITYPLFNYPYKGLVSRQYPADSPHIIIRGGRDNGWYGNYDSYPFYCVPTLIFNTANESYSWETDKWRQSYQAPYWTNSTWNVYIIPVVYLTGDSVPIRYDEQTDKYYLDYNLETKYQDYGKHKEGFAIAVRINCETPIGDTTIKVFIDEEATEVYSTVINTFNEFVNITLPDSAVEDLENGEHIITIKSDTYGILGSTSTKYTKVDESVPIILTDSIGHIVEPFNMTYQVYDDDGDSLNVTIKLDGTVISTITDAEQNVDLPLALTTAQFNNINYGDHTIVIEATDGVNTSTATLPFTKNSVPTIELDVHELDVQLEPFSVEVTTNSADGENITVRAYIDNQEITV